jgi:hypothetical protein
MLSRTGLLMYMPSVNPKAPGVDFAEDGRRKVQSWRTLAEDYRNWSGPVLLDVNYAGGHRDPSQTYPYFRVPQIDIALPTRTFLDRGE